MDKLNKEFVPKQILTAEELNLITNKVDEVIDNLGVGKVDEDVESGKKGEIFNDYENNIATGDYSHSEGLRNAVYGDVSHAEGTYNTIKGIRSHAEGGNLTNIYLTGDAGSTTYTLSSGWLRQSLSSKDLISYFNQEDVKIIESTSPWSEFESKIINVQNKDGDLIIEFDKTLSDSEPFNNKKVFINKNIIGTTGKCSHIEGYCNYVTGSSTHLEGNDNTALKVQASHVEGALNYVSGRNNDDCIHVEGFCNTAQNPREHAQGEYNKSNTGSSDDKKTFHSIGIGTKDERKNAQEVMRNGDYYILGIGDYNGTNPDAAKTLQEVISEMLGRLDKLENPS